MPRSSEMYRRRHITLPIFSAEAVSPGLSRVGVTRQESETSFLCGPATRRTPAEDAARTAVADESGDTSRRHERRRIARSARKSGSDEDIREPRTKTPRHEDATPRRRSSIVDEDTGRRARKTLGNTGRIPHRRMREDTRRRRRRCPSILYREVPG
ncbi:uncharacterized protein LOC121854712 [Homarus americanus]|uniref:uncharacterized protein LOC121854712 n=1 Tax=Homarus americanus TaxID=6706 RepID=UPI001C43AE03|nr:uncharacterized protein LOC121854712 [Homarus americanus]